MLTTARRGGAGRALALMAGSVLSACGEKSETVRDEYAGMNGGFEVTRSGVPVNWIVYTPKTIPDGDYDLVVDSADYHGGKQSLRFVVREASSDGGWRSPGFSQEFPATPGQTYKVGFWVKNQGAEFLARVGGVSAFDSEYETIVRSSDPIGSWRRFEHEYKVPLDFNKLRFELNVLRAGTFWIDDVTVERTS